MVGKILLLMCIGLVVCIRPWVAAAATRPMKSLPVGAYVIFNGRKYVKTTTDNKFVATKRAVINCADTQLEIGQSQDFDYTGGEQTWTLYAGCAYKLEVWGAQGGKNGGYGGYATGIFARYDNTTIYINVGQQGNANSTIAYNGGGRSNGNNITGDGGGLTHISLLSGQLKNLSAYKDTAGANSSNEILLVGGAGGGRSEHNYAGGNGGGYIGNVGMSNTNNSYRAGGGTQSAVGAKPGNMNNAPLNEAAFGLGGGAETLSSCQTTRYWSGGGGGGWYGGSGGAWSCGGDRDTAGGGGSGYINSPNLVSNEVVAKHMTCYNCTTSTDAGTYTISNTCVNSTATADCSKTGNGYARITRLE